MKKFFRFFTAVIFVVAQTTSFAILAFSVGVPMASADIPTTLGYQGRLKDSSGNALTGTYSFTFRFYASSTGGVATWTETQPTVVVDAGSFAVDLGSVTPFPPAVDFNAPLFLTTEVNGDGEMAPRVPVNSVPYAMTAGGINALPSAPASASGGRMYYDTGLGTLNYYDATAAAWKALGTTTSSIPSFQQVTNSGNTTTNAIQFAGGTSTAPLTVEGQVSSTAIIANSGTITSLTVNNLTVTGSAPSSFTNLIWTNATGTNTTSTNLFATNGTITSGILTNGTVSSLVFTNGTSTSWLGFATASGTTLNALSGRINFLTAPTLISSSATLSGGTINGMAVGASVPSTGVFTNTTSTNATTTNLFATNASTTQLFANTETVGTLTASSSSFSTLTFANGTSTSWLGFATASGTTLNASAIAVNGSSVCLANGTNCPSGTSPNFQTVTNSGNTTTNAIQFAGGTSTADFLPSVDATLSLGSAAFRWDATLASTTSTNATTTNLFATNLTATNGSFATLSSASGTVTTLNSTNGTVSNLVWTNATGTNLFVTDASFGTLAATTGTFAVLNNSTLNGDDATFSNVTTTSLTATDGTVRDLIATNATVTNLSVIGSVPTNFTNLTWTNATGTNTTSTNLFATNGMITNGILTNGTVSNLSFSSGTSTSWFGFVTASGTSLNATNATINNLTSQNAVISGGSIDGTAIGATTPASGVFTGTTSTNATTTNLFATSGNLSALTFADGTSTSWFGFATASGTSLSASSIAVNGSSVCLQNGTNCPAGSATSTLQQVTDQGNVTTDAIQFAGGTSTADFVEQGNLAVTGQSTFGNVSSTNQSLSGTLTVTGLTNLSNALFVNATGTNLELLGLLIAPQALITNVSSTNVTTTNLFVTNENVGNIVGTSAAFTNLSATNPVNLANLTWTNATGTNTTSTNLFATNGTMTNGNISNLSFANGTSTSWLGFNAASGTTVNASNGTIGTFNSSNGVISTFSFDNGTSTAWFGFATASGTTVNAANSTLGNLLATVFNSPNATISGGSLNGTPIGASNPSTGVFTSVTSTSATSTNLFATNAQFTNLSVGNSAFTNITWTNATGTNTTSTNLFATNGILTNGALTNGSVTNLSFTNGTSTSWFGFTAASGTSINATNVTANNLTSQNVVISGGMINGTSIGASSPSTGIFTNTTSTNATTTNLFVSGVASTTQLFANSATIGSLTVGSENLSNLTFANGSSTSWFGFVTASGTSINATNGTVNNLTSPDAIISGGSIDGTPIGNAVPSTGVFTNTTSTNATSTNLFATNLQATNDNATNLTWTNATGTNTTSTNLFATNGSLTNGAITNGTVSNLTFMNGTSTSWLGFNAASGTSLSASSIQVNGSSVCLANATNCPTTTSTQVAFGDTNNTLTSTSTFTFASSTGILSAPNVLATVVTATKIGLATTNGLISFNNGQFGIVDDGGTQMRLGGPILNGLYVRDTLVQTGAGDFGPVVNNFTDLGTTAKAFANLYASGTLSTLNGINFNNATGTNATTTNLAATTVSTTNLFVGGKKVCLADGTNCSIAQAKSAASTATTGLSGTETDLLDITVTPSFTTDVVWASGDVRADDTGLLAASTITLRLRRGASCAAGVQVGVDITSSVNAGATDNIAFSFVDAPNTTAATTYRLCALGTGGTPDAANRTMITQTATAGADLAEVYYSADPTLAPGEVVELDPQADGMVRRAASAYDPNVLGVISTKPGLLLSEAPKASGTPVMLALSGRIPVNVTSANGPIEPGDELTASPVPGFAMKATESGTVIGQALSGFDGPGKGMVMMFVKNGSWTGSTAALGLPAGAGSSAAIASIQATLKDDASNTGSSEVVSGNVLAGTLTSNSVAAQEADIATLKPLVGSLSVALQGDGRFIIGDATVSGTDVLPAASFDRLGNATFAGALSAQGIQTGEVSASSVNTGVLVAGNIQSPTLDLIASGTQALSSSLASSLGLMSAVSTGEAGLESRVSSLEALVKGLQSTSATSSDGQLGLSLDAVGSLVVSRLASFPQGIQANQISSLGQAIQIMGNVQFAGRTTFDSDSGGYAVVKAGSRSVDVVFAQAYAAQPIVNATISFADPTMPTSTFDGMFAQGLQYFIVNQSSAGFEILFNKPVPQDVTLDWTAVAVANPNTFTSTDVMPDDQPQQIPVVAQPQASIPPVDASVSSTDDGSPTGASSTDVLPPDPATPTTNDNPIDQAPIVSPPTDAQPAPDSVPPDAPSQTADSQSQVVTGQVSSQ